MSGVSIGFSSPDIVSKQGILRLVEHMILNGKLKLRLNANGR
jgi:hypothetical protein